MKERILNLLWSCTILLCAGLFYAKVLIPIGFHIPCIFRTITGLKCPGCGITGQALALLRGDLITAISCNYGIAFMSPFLVCLMILFARRYLMQTVISKLEKHLANSLLIASFVWFFIRNLWDW